MLAFVNDALKDYLGCFVVVFVDDILVYQVRLVLARLRAHQLYVKLEKCVFHVSEIPFLGYIISKRGVQMDQATVQAVLDWPSHGSVKEVQLFLGFQFVITYRPGSRNTKADALSHIHQSVDKGEPTRSMSRRRSGRESLSRLMYPRLLATQVRPTCTKYWWEGMRADIHRVVASCKRPKATVKVQPAERVFIRERVTLTCDIESGGVWNYEWFKNNDPLSEAQRRKNYEISNVDGSHEGDYTCKGRRSTEPRYSEISAAVRLTVSVKPKPKLTLRLKGAALRGSSVTLECVLDQSAGWRFYWTKHTQNPQNGFSTETYSHTISSVSVSDGGQYWCRAGRGNPVNYTPYSDTLRVNVTEPPKPVVSIKPDKDVFRGETVTLRCDIQAGGDTEWKYSWIKSDPVFHSHSTTQEYTISPVTESNSGKYTCRGERRSDSQLSEISDAVTLTVFGEAQAVLSVSPQSWLTEGDSVTLSCEVRDSSTGWTFSWYRDGEELHSDSRREAGGSYTLSAAALHHTGVYECRAKRGEPAFHTQYSNLQPLWITGISTPVTLFTHPSRGQHIINASLSLSCEGQSDSTGWRVRRCTHSGKVSDCTSGWGSVTGSICSISSLSTSHTGVYWCQSETGGRSHPVNITVHSPSNSEAQFSVLSLLSSLLAMSPYLLVSIILGVKCYRARAQPDEVNRM
ncbi:Fc receptor-like protein 5 [Salminus brasiliensis]|uniref:Fc receptor-like protein 5 n=1 Tax=Salminus brasiliensis TaxID=930266 RepID=UPI003B8360C4